MPGKRKVVGILGGMGPLATADIFHKLIQATPVNSEQEHLRIIIDSDPTIPDRTEAFYSGKLDSLAEILSKKAQKLVEIGAELIAIPCNNAHLVYGKVNQAVSVPVVDMVAEVVGAVRNRARGKTLVLMAMPSVIESGLYSEPLEQAGFRVLGTDEQFKNAVAEAVYEIKTSGVSRSVRGKMRALIRNAFEGGAECVVSACTEVPLALTQEDTPLLQFFDCNRILAEAVVREAIGSAE